MRTSVIPINTHTAKKPTINLQSKSTGINWLVYIRNGLWLVKFREKIISPKEQKNWKQNTCEKKCLLWKFQNRLNKVESILEFSE